MTPAADRVWLPYCGAAPEPASWLDQWNFDPLVLVALAVLVVAVARSERRALGVVSVALLALLFVTPFCALTSALFSARVTHHIVLTALVAPLLTATFAMRLPGSLGLWTGLQAVTFWAWHAPPAFGSIANRFDRDHRPTVHAPLSSCRFAAVHSSSIVRTRAASSSIV